MGLDCGPASVELNAKAVGLRARGKGPSEGEGWAGLVQRRVFIHTWTLNHPSFLGWCCVAFIFGVFCHFLGVLVPCLGVFVFPCAALSTLQFR